MVDISKDEAKQILISMTKSGMEFNGDGGWNGPDGKPRGSLVFKKDDADFRSAYVKIGSIVNGEGITSFEVSKKNPRINSGNIVIHEITNENIVKQMAGYCEDLGKSRV
jgi:hypothetical protein